MRDTAQKPIRFGTGAMSADPRALIEAAQTAERLGFSTFGLNDHFASPFAPMIGLQAISDATTTLRLTMTVLNQDFRHPAVLGKDLATLDVLSGGRLEVGIGSGWMKEDYDRAGIPFLSASSRIERLEEVVVVLKGLFGDAPVDHAGVHFQIRDLRGVPTPCQRPRPPIMIGGSGPKLLSVAGRQADIVHVISRSHRGGQPFDPEQFAAKTFERKVSTIREAAGDRFADIELSTAMMGLVIAKDRKTAIEQYRQTFTTMIDAIGYDLSDDPYMLPVKLVASMTEADFVDSPAFALGTIDEVGEKLLETRERYGFNYFYHAGFSGPPEVVGEVLDWLGGR